MVIFLGLRGSNLYEVNWRGGVGGRLSLNNETHTCSTTVLVIIPGVELGASQNPTNVATSGSFSFLFDAQARSLLKAGAYIEIKTTIYVEVQYVYF